MAISIDDRTEWLEADGLGGFASGTTLGIRTRRYHALLLAAAAGTNERFVLVNGVAATLRTPNGEFPLTLHSYAPGVTNQPDGVCIESFTPEPWPRWVVALPDGTRVAHEVFVPRGQPRAVVSWRLIEPQAGARLLVRPLMSGRDYHALHHENSALRFEAELGTESVRWRPYEGVPGTIALHSGTYRHDPLWYRRFQYDQERERGHDYLEDLASPGVFEFDVSAGDATLVLTAEVSKTAPSGARTEQLVARLRASERTRRTALAPVERAAEAYLVRGSHGTTVIAGYPWFGDWGRDTFIALRGLCLATGRLDEARQSLLAWSACDSRGVLPNRFADRDGAPEYNTVDASLWFIIAAHELMEAHDAAGRPLSESDGRTLRRAISRILTGYAAGTHHGIRLDDDGLLAAGEVGVQLTWMDARVGSRVITPRVGKPVEVQALWLNALRIGASWETRWRNLFDTGLRSFRDRFWNPTGLCLYDVVDADHRPGTTDATFRPNQILAVGGLPLPLLTADRARRVVAAVEQRLWTPLGLRSLAPGHPDYAAYYRGGPEERDSAYHQGTVWPWLLGPFVEAWVRIRGGSEAAKAEARARFLKPLREHFNQAGLGHISEVVDAEPPHTPGGCPFQAWSLGEFLRLDRRVLDSARPTVSVVKARRPRSLVAG